MDNIENYFVINNPNYNSKDFFEKINEQLQKVINNEQIQQLLSINEDKNQHLTFSREKTIKIDFDNVTVKSVKLNDNHIKITEENIVDVKDNCIRCVSMLQGMNTTNTNNGGKRKYKKSSKSKI